MMSHTFVAYHTVLTDCIVEYLTVQYNTCFFSLSAWVVSMKRSVPIPSKQPKTTPVAAPEVATSLDTWSPRCLTVRSGDGNPIFVANASTVPPKQTPHTSLT